MKAKRDLPDEKRGDANPWYPMYGRIFGFVVKAESERKAREIAQENAGWEIIFNEGGHFTRGHKVWTKEKYVTCKPLKEIQEENTVVMRDYYDG